MVIISGVTIFRIFTVLYAFLVLPSIYDGISKTYTSSDKLCTFKVDHLSVLKS